MMAPTSMLIHLNSQVKIKIIKKLVEDNKTMMKDRSVSINDEKKTDSTMTDDAGKLTERQLAYAMLMPH